MFIKSYARYFIRRFKVFVLVFVLCMFISVTKISQVKQHSSKPNEITKPIEVSIDTRITASKDSFPIEIANRVVYSNVHDGLNVQSGRLDKSAKYRIYENVAVGNHYKEISAEYKVTLASFASIDKLYWILDVAR